MNGQMKLLKNIKQWIGYPHGTDTQLSIYTMNNIISCIFSFPRSFNSLDKLSNNYTFHYETENHSNENNV